MENESPLQAKIADGLFIVMKFIAVPVGLLAILTIGFLVWDAYVKPSSRAEMAENVRINSGGTVTLEMLERQERELDAKCKTFNAAIGTEFCSQMRATYQALRLPPIKP
jgi:hypothetical protein